MVGMANSSVTQPSCISVKVLQLSVVKVQDSIVRSLSFLTFSHPSRKKKKDHCTIDFGVALWIKFLSSSAFYSSLQNRRDFLRISGEQKRKRGERETRVACEGRSARKCNL